MYGRLFDDGVGGWSCITMDGVGGISVIMGDHAGGQARTDMLCTDDIGDILDE